MSSKRYWDNLRSARVVLFYEIQDPESTRVVESNHPKNTSLFTVHIVLNRFTPPPTFYKLFVVFIQFCVYSSSEKYSLSSYTEHGITRQTVFLHNPTFCLPGKFVWTFHNFILFSDLTFLESVIWIFYQRTSRDLSS